MLLVVKNISQEKTQIDFTCEFEHMKIKMAKLPKDNALIAIKDYKQYT